VAVIEVKRRADFAGIEHVRNLGLKGNQIFGRHALSDCRKELVESSFGTAKRGCRCLGRSVGSAGRTGVQFTESLDLPLAARLVVLGEILLRVEENDLAAGKLELKRHFNQPGELFADLGLLFRRHKQQDESAATRTQ